MAKRIKREDSLTYLQSEMQTHAANASALRKENELLRSDRMMLIEALTDLTSDESYWSKEALQSGIVWRLKNVVNNIKNG